MVRIVMMVTMIIVMVGCYYTGTDKHDEQKSGGECSFFHNGLFV